MNPLETAIRNAIAAINAALAKVDNLRSQLAAAKALAAQKKAAYDAAVQSIQPLLQEQTNADLNVSSLALQLSEAEPQIKNRGNDFANILNGQTPLLPS